MYKKWNTWSPLWMITTSPNGRYFSQIPTFPSTQSLNTSKYSLSLVFERFWQTCARSHTHLTDLSTSCRRSFESYSAAEKLEASAGPRGSISPHCLHLVLQLLVRFDFIIIDSLAFLLASVPVFGILWGPECHIIITAFNESLIGHFFVVPLWTVIRCIWNANVIAHSQFQCV